MKIGIPYLLLAEDDPDDRDFFSTGMDRVYPNILTRSFENGNELLTFLDRCQATQLPRCIVLDYKMHPDNAPQILYATGAGTRFAHIPKIVWSTSERETEREECLRLGAARFVVKPLTDDHLDNLLHSFSHWLEQPPRPITSGPSDHAENNRDDRNYQQQVNDPAGMIAKEADSPGNDEDDRDGVQ